MNNLEQGSPASWGKVFLWAALFRLVFLAWSWTPWLAEPQDGMSRLYFKQGYGMAVGYGYISSEAKGGPQLKTLYEMVEVQKPPVTTLSAPPLNRDNVWPEMLHPPGMAALISVLYRLLHVPADLPMEIIGLLLDSISAALLCVLITKVWSPSLGYALGLGYAFFPPLAYGSASSRSPEGLMGVFITGTVLGQGR